MMTLSQLMAAGDDLFSRNVLEGEPDWKALHATTPDDVMPDEDGESDIAAKLSSIAAITDDALFAKALSDLTESMQ